MKEKRYILATQDEGAFIGTAAEVTEAWLKAVGNRLEIRDKGYVVVFEDGSDSGITFTQNEGRPTMQKALEYLFRNEVIPNQCESHSVYVLDVDTDDALTAHPWHFDSVAAY